MTTQTTFSTRDAAFVRDFHTMSEFGATENGGVERQAASAPDGQQRQWLTGLLEARGFTVQFDRAGNQWGLYEAVPGAPFVVVGSHMDSQPTAGRYDGAYGVLAAAHAAFRLVEQWAAAGPAGQPRFNIAVVNWFNEEGSRFKPSMMGSSVYTGKLELETALATTDAAGVSVRDALDAIGCRGDYEGPEAAYCAEIHIEQGRSMEREGITIGLVNSNWAANKYEFVVHGEQAHTGSTVIADRKDALLGASMMVVAARELADAFPGVLHTSVGQLTVYPNSPVVVPSRVSLLLDLRSADEAVLAEADALLHQRITEIERLANVTVERNHSHSWPVTPVPARRRGTRGQGGGRPGPGEQAGDDPGRARFDQHEGPRADRDAVRAQRGRDLPQRARIHHGRGHRGRADDAHRGGRTGSATGRWRTDPGRRPGAGTQPAVPG